MERPASANRSGAAARTDRAMPVMVRWRVWSATIQSAMSLRAAICGAHSAPEHRRPGTSTRLALDAWVFGVLALDVLVLEVMLHHPLTSCPFRPPTGASSAKRGTQGCPHARAHANLRREKRCHGLATFLRASLPTSLQFAANGAMYQGVTGAGDRFHIEFPQYHLAFPLGPLPSSPCAPPDAGLTRTTAMRRERRRS